MPPATIKTFRRDLLYYRSISAESRDTASCISASVQII